MGLFPSHNDRELKRLEKTAAKIEALADRYHGMTNAQLKACTDDFKARLAAGETTDDLLPEAFAVVREAADRVLNMRHFHVQLLGGIVLYQGRIAEMCTGEGKTLVATLPAYLMALEGRGVHVVTVNEYLASRDSDWMGQVYSFLGLKVGCIKTGQSKVEKQNMYACDITYGTNNEFGFDYLRDNMVKRKEQKVQRELRYAIVDEVDSVLIDEARTPLIISGQSDQATDVYEVADRFVKSLTPPSEEETADEGESKKKKSKTAITEKMASIQRSLTGDSEEENGDFEIDEKENAIRLTDSGVAKAEAYYHLDNLSDAENTELQHVITQALTANYLKKRDTDYVVNDGEVIIVDEFTGRLMIGRRYSEGLHQAIEAKEGLLVRNESKTYATITFQNYFRLYKKLAGMTGTAKTEETEFQNIYGLDVVQIPTNKPVRRLDEVDHLYKSREIKIRAIVKEVAESYKRGQPILVGTVSVEKSEILSHELKKARIPHNVLNAKNHEQEAEIIAQAGRKGTVTIATNMAGRGTDILLGGNPDFLARKKLENLGYAHDIIVAASSQVAEAIEEERQATLAEARPLYQAAFDEAKAAFGNEEAARRVARSAMFARGYDRDIVVALSDGTPETEEVRHKALLSAIADYRKYYELFKQDTDKEKQEVIDLGGLRILGTERHESRRIDNQLRGRAGRQGDPGSSVFYLSMEDDLIRVFGDTMVTLGERLPDTDEPITMRVFMKGIQRAQERIEDRNYSIRKHVLSYDDVMNTQRGVIYAEREKVLEGEDVHEQIVKMIPQVVAGVVQEIVDYRDDYHTWDYAHINDYLEQRVVPKGSNVVTESLASEMAIDTIIDAVVDAAVKGYEDKKDRFNAKCLALAEENNLKPNYSFADVERDVMLQVVDGKWIDHIDDMDALRKGIGLRQYGQVDPVVGYQQEGYELFNAMTESIQETLVLEMLRFDGEPALRSAGPVRTRAKLAAYPEHMATNERGTVQRKSAKIGRNDLCPCGSGKKYKNCCGAPGAVKKF